MPGPVVDLADLSDDSLIDELNSEDEDAIDHKPCASQSNGDRSQAIRGEREPLDSSIPQQKKLATMSQNAVGSSSTSALASQKRSIVVVKDNVASTCSPRKSPSFRKIGSSASISKGKEKELAAKEIAQLTKGALKSSRYISWNMKHLHDMIENDFIDLSPTYQRDVVWPESKQMGLIQSIFLNYFIMPVLFAVEKDDDGEEIRICIDGKQRCTSIKQFMNGEIPFKTQNGDKYWYKVDPGSKKKLLPDVLRKRFDLTQIPVVEYDDLTDMQQRDMFQRVQLGVPLTASEKLQAIPGPWAMFTAELEKKYVLSEPGGLKQKLPQYDASRGRPFQQILAAVMMAHDPSYRGIPSLIPMTKFLNRKDPPDAYFRNQMDRTMSIFVNIATNYHNEAFGVTESRVAPVEFWFIALIIYQRMNIRSVRRLADDIRSMRAHVREKFIDLRTNSTVVKYLHEFMSQLPKNKYSNEPIASEEQIVNAELGVYNEHDDNPNGTGLGGDDDDDEFFDDDDDEAREEVKEKIEDEECYDSSNVQRAQKRRREYDDDPSYVPGGISRYDPGSAVVDNLRSRPIQNTATSPSKRPEDQSSSSREVNHDSGSLSSGGVGSLKSVNGSKTPAAILNAAAQSPNKTALSTTTKPGTNPRIRLATNKIPKVSDSTIEFCH